MQVRSGTDAGFRPSPPPLASPSQQLALTPSDSKTTSKDDGFQLFGDDGLGFFDFIDIINPLQHLPFVGPLYREWTGDELAAGPRMMGSTLYFGPIGLVGSALDVVLEGLTGKDLGGNIMSVLGGDEDTGGEGKTGPGTEIVEAPAETVSISANEPTAAGTDAADPVTAWAIAELNFREAQAAKLGLNVPARPYSQLLSKNTAPMPPAYAPVPPELQARVSPSHPGTVPDRADEIRRANAAYRAASLNQHRQDAGQQVQAEPGPGAIANNGGWFTAAMLEALAKLPSEPISEPTPSNPNKSASSVN